VLITITADLYFPFDRQCIPKRLQQLHWTRKTIGVTLEQTSITGKLHSGRCYPKNSEGMAFASSNPKQDIPCIGGDREPRRATTDVHSLPVILFFISYQEMRVCSLFSFLFFKISTETFSYTCTFWRQGNEEKYQWKESWT
jgi:hypothetical protein